VADIFISYTSSDRDWAFWIGQELQKLGDVPHIHEWEIPGGGDIPAWMNARLKKADHVLCVVSPAYLNARYSGWELRAAQWAAQDGRPNFALPVFIEDCEPPPLLAPLRRCNLYGIGEEEARARFAAYLSPAAKPVGPARFPGKAEAAGARYAPHIEVPFPGDHSISVPAPPSSQPLPSEPPPVANKDDDLEAIKKTLDDAAPVSGALWFSYLFVLFYLAVAAGAVTHADLFFEKPVKLPFLNVELPLLGFFLVAPILFLIVHAYTLVHLAMLGDKANWFHRELYRQIKMPDELPKPERARRQKIRTDLRRQLPSNIFVQLLAGPSALREGGFGWLLSVIVTVTLIVAPVLLLLLMQIQFLPYHDSFRTWSHRVVLLLDIGLLWWLWGRIISGHAIGDRRQISFLWRTIASVSSLLVVFFSVMVVTFPGEWQEDFLAKWDQPKWTAAPHDWLFNGPVDQPTRRRTSLFSSTLVLPGLNVYEGLGIDDPDKAKWHDFVFRARGRDLKGAIFDLTTLPKVDFEGADLQGASLVLAQLQGVSLKNADLRGAVLDAAKLQGASLDGTRLEDALLRDAVLQGASLYRARLQGAVLFSAQLQGASLQNAMLEGATLAFAQLQGAWLFGAQVQGASLNAAQLEGATLDAANLGGASLGYANLQGASLQQTLLRATDLTMAFLWRTNRADRIPGAPLPTAPSHVRLPDAPDHWLPIWRDGQGNVHPWNDAVYQDLRRMIESLPAGLPHDQALESIRRVDCANSDPTLPSCDPSAPMPAQAAQWRKSLEEARADDAAHAKALAEELRLLVCSGDDQALYIMRGEGFQQRLQAAGAAASGLIDKLANKDRKDCPVSASLTDADKAKLLSIKQDAIKKPGG
jgi:uncharacterized protein YjbI with pentapeptide repeats